MRSGATLGVVRPQVFSPCSSPRRSRLLPPYRLLHYKPSPLLNISAPYLYASRAGLTNSLVQQNSLQTCQRRNYVLESVLMGTTSVLHAIHAIVPSWALTIPLFSACFYAVCSLPLQARLARIRARREQLSPLVYALSHAKSVSLSPSNPTSMIGSSLSGIRTEVYARFGVQPWKSKLMILTLPIWLVGSETVRRILGSSQSVLGLFGGLEGDELARFADPTLTTGGILWFTDLTAADPYHVLPLVMGAGLLYRALPRNSREWVFMFGLQVDASGKQRSPRTLSVALPRIRVIFAICVPWMAWDLSAGLLLYWISMLFSMTLAGRVFGRSVLEVNLEKLKCNMISRERRTAPPVGDIILRGSMKQKD